GSASFRAIIRDHRINRLKEDSHPARTHICRYNRPVGAPVKHLPGMLKYLWPYKKLAVFSALITGVGALLALLAPWPLKILIDNVIQHSPGPGIVVRLTNATGGNQITLMVVIVAAGLALTILAGAL